MYNCVGGFAVVQQRVQHFLWQKSGTYYFVRRVPKDIQEYYKSSRVVICLKTKRRDSAVKASRSIAQRLEDYWLSLRLSKLDMPALHLLRDKPPSASTSMTLSDALELYLRLNFRYLNKSVTLMLYSVNEKMKEIRMSFDVGHTTSF